MCCAQLARSTFILCSSIFSQIRQRLFVMVQFKGCAWFIFNTTGFWVSIVKVSIYQWKRGSLRSLPRCLPFGPRGSQGPLDLSNLWFSGYQSQTKSKSTSSTKSTIFRNGTNQKTSSIHRKLCSCFSDCSSLYVLPLFLQISNFSLHKALLQLTYL